MDDDIIFEPLGFRNLTVKNRILRSNMSGRFDNYDGSGAQARINWEEKFARGGVGAILSAHVPVTIRGHRVRSNSTSTSPFSAQAAFSTPPTSAGSSTKDIAMA